MRNMTTNDDVAAQLRIADESVPYARASQLNANDVGQTSVFALH
jgi:hypothetical protein